MPKNVKKKAEGVKKAQTEAGQNDEKKTSRQQISKLIGINLSVSRVRKYVDKCNVNQDVESACVELREMVRLQNEGNTVDRNTLSESTQQLVNKAYSDIYDVRLQKYNNLRDRLGLSKSATDKKRLKEMEAFPKKENTIAENIDYVSKLRCRFSNDASVVLSSVLDYVVQDLVRTAMVNARSLGKAIIQVNHIIQSRLDISMYPLVSNLRVVQQAINNRDLKEDTEDVVEEEKTEAQDDNGSTFEFYINLICKSVKAALVAEDENYTSIRISKNIRKFCSDIVIQLIERVSPLIKLYAQTARVKTINDDVMKFIFKFLLLDAGVNNDLFVSYVNERISTYHSIKDSK